MLPFVYGFKWTPGYLIFLGIFYAVLMVIGATLAMALRRARLAHRARKAEAIRWHADFGDLAARDRACRHDIDGRMPGRVCQLGFDCRTCEKHAEVMKRPAPERAVAMNAVPVPLDRMYHRGHTWVQPQPDGTVLVGLDEMARRLTGKPGRTELPHPGALVQVNGTAWRMSRNGFAARVLSPVDGVVLETGGPERGWYLKVKPANTNFRHLLEGSEAAAWMQRELDRVGMLLAVPATGATLADGGTLVEDAPAAMPDADWNTAWGALFLNP